MFNRNRNFPGVNRRSGFSPFFKFWFAFCALAGVAVLAVQLFVGVTVFNAAQDPEALGNYIGSVVKGIEEATQ